MALKRPCPEIGLLRYHSEGLHVRERGLPGFLLDARGIVCSMTAVGNCHDNAVMESLFSNREE